MNLAINKTFLADVKEREAGRTELGQLCGQDGAVPFFIGYVYQIEYDYTKSPDDAQKALKEYKGIVDGGCAFVQKNIQNLKTETNNKSICLGKRRLASCVMYSESKRLFYDKLVIMVKHNIPIVFD